MVRTGSTSCCRRRHQASRPRERATVAKSLGNYPRARGRIRSSGTCRFTNDPCSPVGLCSLVVLDPGSHLVSVQVPFAIRLFSLVILSPRWLPPAGHRELCPGPRCASLAPGPSSFIRVEFDDGRLNCAPDCGILPLVFGPDISTASLPDSALGNQATKRDDIMDTNAQYTRKADTNVTTITSCEEPLGVPENDRQYGRVSDDM